MNLPNAKGTYVLIASVLQMKRIEVGQLGEFDIVPGFYAYVGSAFGAGGLGARICFKPLNPSRSGTRPQTKSSSTTGPNSWRRLRSFAFPFPVSARRITTAAVPATCFTPSDAPNLSGLANSCWSDSSASTQNDM